MCAIGRSGEGLLHLPVLEHFTAGLKQQPLLLALLHLQFFLPLNKGRHSAHAQERPGKSHKLLGRLQNAIARCHQIDIHTPHSCNTGIQEASLVFQAESCDDLVSKQNKPIMRVDFKQSS